MTTKAMAMAILTFLVTEVGRATPPGLEPVQRRDRAARHEGEEKMGRLRKTSRTPISTVREQEELPAGVRLAGPVRQRLLDDTEGPTAEESGDAVTVNSPAQFSLNLLAGTDGRATNAAPLVFPVQGSQLANPQVFRWNPAGVGWYWLWVGSCQDCTDIADWDLGGNTSTSVNLPSDGRTIYVTLFTFSNGMWFWYDYSFRGPGGRFVAPEITSPSEGSTLSASQMFRWSAGSGIGEYYLWMGSCRACSDLYDASAGRNLFATLPVPRTGRPIYLTLWFWANGDWYFREYQYRAPSAVSSSAPVRVEVTNRLGYAINISVNGRMVGSVPAYETRTHEEFLSSLDFRWELVRPTLNGRTLGDPVVGLYDPISNPSGTVRFEITNRFRDGSGVFMPWISNKTATAMYLEVNGGLESQNRCNCTIPAFRDNVVAGYYRLFSNSNVRLHGRGDYSGGYIYWQGQIPSWVRDTSGRVDLTANTAPSTR